MATSISERIVSSKKAWRLPALQKRLVKRDTNMKVSIHMMIPVVVTRGKPVYYSGNSVWYYTHCVITDDGTVFNFQYHTGIIGKGGLYVSVDGWPLSEITDDDTEYFDLYITMLQP